MPNTPTQLAAALDGLHTAAKTALPDVSVVDGPPIDWDGVQLADGDDENSEDNYLFVGATPDDGGVGGAQLDYNAAGNVSRDDRGSFVSTIRCRSGDEDTVKAVRDTAFGILAAVAQTIRSDQTLGGAVLYARVASVDGYTPLQDEDGVTVWLQFTVAYRAYLS